jgi:hypothetical protein
MVLASCFIFSVLTIIILTALGNNQKPNGFNRKLIMDAIEKRNELDIKYNSFYLAGLTSDRIYLGNYSSPMHLLTVNYSLSDTHHTNIFNPGRIKYRATHMTVDSPNIYVADEVKYGIVEGSLTDLKMHDYRTDSSFFADAIPISASSCILRAMKPSTKEAVLVKEGLDKEKPYKKYADNLLEKQVDGWFCTDGIINYNSKLKWLVYLYCYRNEFMCIDTNLNLIYKAKTIDTCTRAKLAVGKINSENSITLTSKPFIVNKKSCVAGDILFVNSNLKADNESKRNYLHASVIDIYNLKDGQYKFSFYIPDYGKDKISHFRVSGNMLIAEYKHNLVTYKLNSNYFK